MQGKEGSADSSEMEAVAAGGGQTASPTRGLLLETPRVSLSDQQVH